MSSKSKYYKRVLPADYCIIDLETTGLIPDVCEIIELAALKVKDGKVIDSFQTLVKPEWPINDFIADFTGITNEMVEDAPRIQTVIGLYMEFIGQDFLIGHNTSFDLNFLRRQTEVTNYYADTLQFSRKLFPGLSHHTLFDLQKCLNLSTNEHRALADCRTTYQLCEVMKTLMFVKGLEPKDIFTSYNKYKNYKWDFETYKASEKCPINLDSVQVDEDNYFYDKHCCFTGTLEKLTRKDAWTLLTKLGGHKDVSVSKKTNFLILGNLDLGQLKGKDKSSKQIKAEQLMQKGQDISIISEDQFYELVNI